MKDMCVDMCVDMCMDMCMDTCIEMCTTDMCIDMRMSPQSLALSLHDDYCFVMRLLVCFNSMFDRVL